MYTRHSQVMSSTPETKVGRRNQIFEQLGNYNRWMSETAEQN